MEEKQVPENDTRRRTQQQISVPFLWEERPGTPKRDWKPKVMPVTPAPPLPLPAKFIISVPFKWEEKPGTPLRCFQQEASELTFEQRAAENKRLPPPPAYGLCLDDCACDGGSSFGSGDGGGDWLSKLDFEVGSDHKGKSFSSAASLLANGLVPTSEISAAVPLPSIWLPEYDPDNCRRIETPASPESGSSTSSYATGTMSPVGSSFLEHLFPLYSPRSGFLQKACYSNEGPSSSGKQNITPEQKLDSFSDQGKGSVAIRRPLTLGELIMLSRRRSCQRKAVRMRKQSLSEEVMKKKVIGCCMFGAGNSGMAKLLGKKSLLMLKLA
ncbi:hypothetical protein Nepgr_010651 [Nepenthes gracilis]|uniref:Hydroxyproline-rich glycoprotein family protein n=1 Tax=Nepenthes gracilis TaxID=150966 RepID=A0AAD3SDK6_NEPGR|nr:hypothetical protein Nepgr_010651 [Nepenthes gracilis]